MVQTSVFRGCWNALGTAKRGGLKLTGNFFQENMAVMLSLDGGVGGGRLVADMNVFEDNVEGFVNATDGVFPIPRLHGARGSSYWLGREAKLGREDGRRATNVVVRGCCSERESKDPKNPEHCAYIQGKSYIANA